MSKALELSQGVKDKLAELEALSEKVEGGEKGARKEVRKAVRESALEVISRASDIGRRGRWALIKTIAAKDPLTEVALVARLDLMLAEVAEPPGGPLSGEGVFAVALDRSPRRASERAAVYQHTPRAGRRDELPPRHRQVAGERGQALPGRPEDLGPGASAAEQHPWGAA